MKSLKVLVATVLCLVYTQASWAKGLERLSYMGIDVSYGWVDFNFGREADGPKVDVFFDVGSNVFVLGSYASLKADESSSKASGYSVGLGYHHALNPTVDLVPTVEFIDATTRSYDRTGWSAGLGLRALVSPRIELAGGSKYVDLHGDVDVSFGFSAYLYPLDKFGLGVGYDVSDDAKTVQLGARMLF